MLFNSLEFLIFLPIVFLLYWFVFGRSYRWQNFFLILASGVFYAWWDWRTLPLIFLTIVSTYFSGLGIKHYQSNLAVLQYNTGQDRTGQDRTGQDRTGQIMGLMQYSGIETKLG